MYSWVRALGATLWVLIGAGLIIITIFLAYESSLRQTFLHLAHVAGDGPRTSVAPEAARPAAAAAREARPAAPNSVVPASAPAYNSTSATVRSEAAENDALLSNDRHGLFLAAVNAHNAQLTVELGKQLDALGQASPTDLVAIAHAFYVVQNCATALLWNQRARDAMSVQGQMPSAAIERITRRCKPRHFDEPSVATTPRTGGAGNADINLGERLYGIGRYQPAIVAIERGLANGATELDEAYVYLGLAQLAAHDPDAACEAFDQLQGVANLTPHIARLWKLFADMHC